jgi:hypothetical protein
MVEGPFHPTAGASRVTLTLDITKIYLNRAAGGYDELTGHWRFQFALPFHETNVGSVEQFFPHLLHLLPTGQQP